MTVKMPKNRLSSDFTRACGLLLCLLMASVVTSHAQEQSPKRGFNPGGSYAISDIETVSTTGGNLSLNVPLGMLPAGRGGMKASVNLVYNSKLWDTYPLNVPAPTEDVTDTDSWNETRLRYSEDGGWRYAFKYDLKLEYRHLGSGTGYCQTEGGASVVFVYKLFLTLPDGSKHEMHLGGPHTGDDGYTDIMPDGIVRYAPESPCPGTTPEYGTLTYYSGDATFLRLEIQHDSDQNWENNPWTLYLPDGGRVTGGDDNVPQRIYDRNNNYIEVIKTLNDSAYGGHTTVRLSDQVGRSAVVEYGSAPNQDSIHVRGTNNELVTTKVLWTNIQVNKSYQAGSPFTRIVATNFRVVSQITLPTQAGGLSYNFSYNAGTANPSYGWGEVSSVTLPTGAKASYQYLRDGANNIRSERVLANHPTRKDLVYRREYDGTAVSNTPCNTQTEATCATETTTYGINFDLMGTVAQDGWFTTPDGGMTRDFVTPLGDVYKSELPDGTVVERLWMSNVPASSLYAVNNYVKLEFTSIRDAAGNLTKTAIKEYSRDKNGNTTQAKEYDWVAYGSVPRDANGRPNALPGGAPLKRVTTSSYYYPTPDASDTATNDADAYYNSTAPRIRNAVAARETSNGTQTLMRSEFFYDNAAAPTVGNLTTRKSWDSTKGASTNPANYVSISTQYNAYGSPTLSTDARGTQTQLTYGAVGGYTDLYPTITKAAYGTTLEQVTTLEYDFYTGAVTRSTDPNGMATATTYDAFGRPTLVRAAEGIAAKETRTATEYLDVERKVIVRSDLTNAGDAKLVSIQHYDQMGRVRLSRTLENAATESETSETSGVKVQTRYLYSGSNSYQLVSNPYRAQYSHQAPGEPSMGWTRSKTDNGGRSVEAQTFDGAALPAPWGGNTSSSGAVTTAYDAEFTTVTDQAGNVRRSIVNGLGQLARVDEPDKDTGSLGSTASPVQPTSYTYDALGNLTQVAQGTQTRTFNYSSLSRLTSATNPESGTVSYAYDAGGNLLTKTDARGISITYTYDALSRNKTTDHSDTAISPDIERYYDNTTTGAYGRGRYWKDYKGGNETVGSEVEHRVVDAYDALGRPLTQRQRFKTGGAWSADYTTSRIYTRSGNVQAQTLPSGHTVNHTYDTAGRLKTFTGNLGDGIQRTYATGDNPANGVEEGIQYDEAGRIRQEKLGTQTPLFHKQQFNARGQLKDIRLGLGSDIWSTERGVITINYGTTANNGNVVFQQNWIPTNESATAWDIRQTNYAYDKLNRVTGMQEYYGTPGMVAQQWFTYDRWGNRQINAGATTDTLNEKQFELGEAAATNRLLAPGDMARAESARWMRYDASGNLIEDSYTGKGARTYDAENRMKNATIGINSSASYTYDADGRRVRRSTPTSNVWQVYGMDGDLLAEYAANAVPSTPQKEYGYRNGELLIAAQSATAKLPVTATTASATTGSSTPAMAVDGNETTSWIAPGFPTQWIELDLGQTRSVGRVRLKVTQTPDGATTHQIKGGTTQGALTTLGTLSGVTQHGQWLEVTFTAASVRYVRVETTSSPSWVAWAEVEVYNGGNGGGEVNWLVSDHLGTPRMIADLSGSLSGIKRHDYLPFGEKVGAEVGGRTQAQGYEGDSVRQQFTGYERDDETGLDFAQARYYASAHGRFTSPDPLLASGRIARPQSWNRYAYVLNNPLKLIDPTGLEDTDPNEQEKKKQEQQQQRQVVNIQDSKVINQRLTEIQKNAKPLAPGEKPVPTNVEHIVGEQTQLHDATVNLPDGSQVQVTDGYMRPVAVAVTDQGGNIINNPNMSVTEKVTPADANAKALEASGGLITSNNQAVPPASNGVFYDVQLRGMGSSSSTYSYQTTQDITIKEGRKGLFRIEGVKIKIDDASRSITITPGNPRRFY